MHMVGRFFWRAGVALSIFALALLAAEGGTVAASPQGGSGPLIQFSGPIYPGMNNGFPYAPVGAPTTVALRGMNQAPYSWLVGHPADVWLYPQHNHSGADHACSAPAGSVHIGNTSALDGTGSATTATFNLPPAYTNAAGPDYGICVAQAGTATPYVFSTDIEDLGGNIFVYNNAPPSLHVTPTTVHPGGTVTVAGNNWGIIQAGLSDSFVQVAIGHCNSGFSLGGTTVNALSGSGNFSVTFTIPASATPQTGVQACAASAYQHIDNNANANGAPPTFAIVATAAATPPSATPTTPPVAGTPTPIPTPGHKGGGAPCSSGMVAMFGFVGGIVWLARRRGR
ncbi:MAG: hypothetical protein H0X24_12330 [Ktedonobacterales bacterium]|nr:hypothetical protein [Ktedonobacterales bacterium]